MRLSLYIVYNFVTKHLRLFMQITISYHWYVPIYTVLSLIPLGKIRVGEHYFALIFRHVFSPERYISRGIMYKAVYYLRSIDAKEGMYIDLT